MNSKVVGVALLLLIAGAYAQNIEEQTYQAFGPFQALIKALVRVGWDLTKLFVGMDDAQIAYFTNQLGIREVSLENINGYIVQGVKVAYYDSSTSQCASSTTTCKFTSFRVNSAGNIECEDNNGNVVEICDQTGSDGSRVSASSINIKSTDSPFIIVGALVGNGYATLTQSTSAQKITCPISSVYADESLDYIVCKATDGNLYAIGDSAGPFTLSSIGDVNADNTIDEIDTFTYIANNYPESLHVPDNAKAQVMLFAILIPLAILTYILIDFFASTGLLRYKTSVIVSIGIALIAMRSGVYTGLLQMIGQLFGPGGFFLSMLSIYLLIAILLWFYGGVRKAKAIAEASEMVSSAVVEGFAYDLKRGLMGEMAKREVAKQIEKETK